MAQLFTVTAFCLTIKYNSRGGKKEKNETLLPRYPSNQVARLFKKLIADVATIFS